MRCGRRAKTYTADIEACCAPFIRGATAIAVALSSAARTHAGSRRCTCIQIKIQLPSGHQVFLPSSTITTVSL